MITDQRGLVSLLTVSIMSLLILILSLGMIQLMTGELLQATDTSDSITAYYTAQGAAENTSQQLRAKLAGLPASPESNDLTALNQSCGASGPSLVYPLPPELTTTSISCVEVVTASTAVTADADQNQTLTYDLTDSVLTSNGYITRLVVSWDNQSASGGGSFTYPGTGAPGSSWTTNCATCGNQPPVMEMGITNYYPGQNTNINPTYSGTLLLDPNPDSSAFAAQKFNYVCYLPNTISPTDPVFTGASNPSCATTPGNTPVVQVECTTAAQNRCTAEIDDVVPPAVNQYRTILTLTPLFHDAQFNLSAYAADQDIAGQTCDQDPSALAATPPDCLAPVALQNAQVDVTVTVGDTTRRVLLNVPARSSQAIDNVLQGDSDICKSFDVLNLGPSVGTEQIDQPNGSNKPACHIQD
jgi:hypothetical protein